MSDTNTLSNETQECVPVSLEDNLTFLFQVMNDHYVSGVVTELTEDELKFVDMMHSLTDYMTQISRDDFRRMVSRLYSRPMTGGTIVDSVGHYKRPLSTSSSQRMRIMSKKSDDAVYKVSLSLILIVFMAIIAFTIKVSYDDNISALNSVSQEIDSTLFALKQQVPILTTKVYGRNNKATEKAYDINSRIPDNTTELLDISNQFVYTSIRMVYNIRCELDISSTLKSDIFRSIYDFFKVIVQETSKETILHAASRCNIHSSAVQNLTEMVGFNVKNPFEKLSPMLISGYGDCFKDAVNLKIDAYNKQLSNMFNELTSLKDNLSHIWISQSNKNKLYYKVSVALFYLILEGVTKFNRPREVFDHLMWVGVKTAAKWVATYGTNTLVDYLGILKPFDFDEFNSMTNSLVKTGGKRRRRTHRKKKASRRRVTRARRGRR